jgi:hypothetical protein
MANTKDCPSPRATPVTRPQWSAGSYLTAEACATEQNYRLQRLRRHNRELHGWGVLCGLLVVPGLDGSRPWLVKICPGYAIGPYGDEIELRKPAAVNVQDFLWFRPVRFVSILRLPDVVYVVVRYQDWLDALEAVPGGACECAEPVYRDSRTGDGYKASVIWTPPAASATPGICQPESPPCPPCPDSPSVTLARIVLPQAGTPITAAMIDNGIRTAV